MKHFFEQIKASLSRSDVYTNPTGNTPKTAILYMVKLVLVISALKAIVFCFILVPLVGTVRVIATEAVAKFPADLVLTTKNGELSMNRPSPFIVEAQKIEGQKVTSKNFIVIDTSKTLDFKAFETYDTSVFLTKNGYMTKEKGGAIKAQTFRDFPDYTLNKSTLEMYKGKMDSILGRFGWLIIPFFMIGMLVVLSVIGFVGALFLSLIGSLIALVVTKSKGYILSFGQLYGLSLRAYTAVILFSLINELLNLPGWIGALLFVLVLFAFIEKKNTEAPAQTVV